MKESKLELNLRVFANKGPVNLPTSQRTADRAYREICDLLTPEERTKITIARSHSDIGESRREFDHVMKAIKQRLLNDPT